ncbi:MAG: glutaredoxin 3 [Candidatus Melainabacteria bacterium RIFOXYA12_FULL_32_12]|nr:MAG: glutaredoxin 3 [Candidatus Melainabacteria bacterium RIFOXYA2_FULL_32_9]OGI31891.1 MAG: glutaredoxin 3 [Candidatus Melainabacteria bacterium RIFOXYA12_FULL_32_12]
MPKAEVKIYTTDYCPYCKKAKSLLASKGLKYEEIDITNDPDTRSKLVQMTGRNTVPQIFINSKHIGGYTDLERDNMSGHLDLLLNEQESES